MLRKLIAVVALVTSALQSSGLAEAPPGDATPRFALLIGVGKYPGLGRGEQLDGSSNDVAIMRDTLIERFGFSPSNVRTLIDEQATGDAIREAMRALTGQVENLPAGSPPAQVVVHFSGHGSQVPDQESGSDRDEADGLDETWVPYDATKQGGDQDIRDDEINEMATGICQDGQARLLIVADCCHSGTGARGTTKVRQLHRDLTPTKAATQTKPLPDGVVFLSACRAREVEPEYAEDDKTYGLLTRFLVETLREEEKVSRLTYDLLQKAIVARYRKQRVMQAPVPQLEGDSDELLKSSILGFGPDVDRQPYYPVETTSSTSLVLLRAGKFHNVTVGSLFELYDQPDQIDSSLSQAWLEITTVDATTSQAKVIRWDDAEGSPPIDFKLPVSFKGGYAILRRHEPDDIGLRLRAVRVEGEDGDGAPLGLADLPKALSDSLNEINKRGESDWLKWKSEQNQPCDLVLRMAGHYAALFPATGVAEVAESPVATRGDVPASLRGGWGPFDTRTGKDNSEEPRTLAEYLRRINRARNLISLAEGATEHHASDYAVKLELLSVDYDFEKDEIVSTKPWGQSQEQVLAMQEEQLYAFRVTNVGEDNKPVYVTVLEISPDMGIQHVMPDDDPILKLEPGEQRTSYVLQCVAPHGTYQAVMLATREEHNFRFVVQDDLVKTRGHNNRPNGSAGSLHDQLEEFTGFQPSKTRGKPVKRRKSDTSWHSMVLSWQTRR